MRTVRFKPRAESHRCIARLLKSDLFLGFYCKFPPRGAFTISVFIQTEQPSLQRICRYRNLGLFATALGAVALCLQWIGAAMLVMAVAAFFIVHWLFLVTVPAFNLEFDAEFLVIRCNQKTIWRAQRAGIIRTELMPLRGSCLLILHLIDGDSFSFNCSGFNPAQLAHIEFLIQHPEALTT